MAHDELAGFEVEQLGPESVLTGDVIVINSSLTFCVTKLAKQCCILQEVFIMAK